MKRLGSNYGPGASPTPLAQAQVEQNRLIHCTGLTKQLHLQAGKPLLEANLEKSGARGGWGSHRRLLDSYT